MSAALLTFAARHPDPLRLYLPDLFLDWRAVLSMCGSGVLESGALSSQHFVTAASLKLLLSMHRVHDTADAKITRHCLPSMYIFGRIYLRDVHIAVKWWLFSHYFVYFLD